jgi:hypothetical protein
LRKLLLLFLAAIFLLPGCATSTSTTTATNTIQPPTVIEKDIVNFLGTQSWTVSLLPGERIEGEVSITDSNSYDLVISTVKDPYGNVISQSATSNEVSQQGYFTFKDGVLNGKIAEPIDNQTYPWKFAFLPALDGVYTFEVNNQEISKPASVRLKVTIYLKFDEGYNPCPVLVPDVTTTAPTTASGGSSVLR